MAGTPDLGEAYRVCARMQRRHDPTYWWATRRLPPELRPAVQAVYGYVRVADEIVDGPGRERDPAGRRATLDAWQRELEDGLHHGGSPRPVVAALVDAAARHDLPLDELRVYLDAMRIDCGRVRMADRAELDRYMRGSAGAVGIVMAHLLGAPAQPMARMATAFQLTNFLRDVAEDWALDRIYLPGIDDADLAVRPAPAAVLERVAGELTRARELFASTAGAAGAVSPRLRPGVRFARAVYGRVLDRIERAGFDVMTSRVAATPLDVGRAALVR